MSDYSYACGEGSSKTDIELCRKANAWDKLMADIKVGEWKIVLVELTTEIASGLDFTEAGEEYEEYNRSFYDKSGTAQELNRLYWKESWQAALRASPKYPGLPE